MKRTLFLLLFSPLLSFGQNYGIGVPHHFGETLIGRFFTPTKWDSIATLAVETRWDSIAAEARQETDKYYKLKIDSLTQAIHILESEIILREVNALLIQGLEQIRHDAIIRWKFRSARKLKKMIRREKARVIHWTDKKY
ncbi:MAG TPA: hypothetical protein VEB40_00900 [Flavipsychrobacter sp.]|nr:hypothetical protein [Flavipsychrobacter sp.]